jgi:hypothetical protein
MAVAKPDSLGTSLERTVGPFEIVFRITAKNNRYEGC